MRPVELMRIIDVMIAHVEKVCRHIFRKRTPNAANLKVATAEDSSDKFERKQRARLAVRLAARVSEDPGPGGDPSVAQELSEGGAADGVGANIVHLSVHRHICVGGLFYRQSTIVFVLWVHIIS
jgi:hypothetical protein